MLAVSRCVELMKRPVLSVWRIAAVGSVWKRCSTGRSTSWPAQDSGLWRVSLLYENRPPRWEVGDDCPRLRRPQGLFLRVRVCIAMLWCPRRDSNPHARRQRLLRPRCLPIPPQGRGSRWSSIGHQYLRWDSNPQHSDFESDASANWATEARRPLCGGATSVIILGSQP